MERSLNQIIYADLIIFIFNYFFEKNSLFYELISNFNELNFNEKITENMNFSEIFENYQNLTQTSFHIIKNSPDTIELNRKTIIPLCQLKRIETKEELKGEIRGIIELRGGYYLSGTKEADIGIYNSNTLELKTKLKFKSMKITQVNHLSKIRDNKLDLVSNASNLNDIIIISVFQDKNIFFDYKIECQIKAHSGKINKILQLSNNLIVSSSSDGYVIFWELIKKSGDSISLQTISKINLGFNVHVLIECHFTNELICNYVTIDLKRFIIKKEFMMWFPQDELFNCAMCLFNKKYIAYVSLCDGVRIINIETNEEFQAITAKYDYVDAVYTIDDETLCLCTRDLYNIFQPRFSQQYSGNNFKEIGKICYTKTCNCYMNDSEGNFIMGDMGGSLIKYIIK